MQPALIMILMLKALNKIVTAYLDIAEVHALNKEPMYMKNWLETIDDYLKMTRRDILTIRGRISHKQAIEKAHAEYDKYKNGNKEKITLMASLLLSKNNNEKKEIIESLFSGKIKDIFSHYFL